MPPFQDLTKVWKNIKEFELRPIQEEALLPVQMVLVGEPGSGRHTLAHQMRRDPFRKDVISHSPLIILSLEDAQKMPRSDLILLVLDAVRDDFAKEQALLQQWIDAGHKVLVLYNKMDLLSEAAAHRDHALGNHGHILYGSALDESFLLKQFVPRVLAILHSKQLALGRQFPLFRSSIAQRLISETCFSNAAYAFSTGIAQIVPVLDLPLNVTDMIVLTKAQAFLVYRMGLLVGFSTRWQDYVTEFGSVIGGGFLWRQLARQLVGLIPVWGIVPKVAVSYAGTYVVGHVVLQWYLTGRHLSRKQIQGLYRQALEHGRQNAQRLAARLPRPKLGRRKKAALPAAVQDRTPPEE